MKRWPVILTGIIDTIYKLDHEIGVSLPTLPAGSEEAACAEEKISEGKAIIEKISKLKYEMARDRPLEYVLSVPRHNTHSSLQNPSRTIPNDGEAYVEEYNAELEKLSQQQKHTWFTAPWLFAE